MIPKILQVVHESVPAPEDDLARATTPAEALAALASAPPREERREVWLKRLHMQYLPDVNETEIWESIVDVPEPINDPDAPLEAIKLEITCVTPYKDGAKFISETFMNALRENGRRPGRGFYIDRVILFEGVKVEVSASAAPTGAGTTAPMLFGGRGRAGATPAAQPGVVSGLPPESLDPLTNEPIENDWQFVIWADVVLEEPPEQGDEGGA